MESISEKIRNYPLTSDETKILKQIGENHFLTTGIDGGKWFVKINRSNGKDEIIYENSFEKCPWDSTVFKNELKNILKTDFLLTGNDWKVAKNLTFAIISSISQYIIIIKKNNSNVTSVTSVTSVRTYNPADMPKNYFFEESQTTKRLKSGQGKLKITDKNNRYYAFPIACEEMVIEKNELVKKKSMKLVMIFNNGSFIEVDEELKSKMNFELRDEITPEQRWPLEDLNNFIKGDSKEKKVYGLKIFNEIKEQYKTYIDFNEESHYDLFALYDMTTYLADLFTHFPYINLWGLKNTGKSKVMELSRLMAHQGQIFVNMTPAVIFRMVDSVMPTLYIDEAENLWDKKSKDQDDTSEIVALLNAGYEKGKLIPRIEKQGDGKMKIVKFDSYCPKMIGSINGIKGALESRCIKVVMVRSKTNIGDSWPIESDEFGKIRSQIYRWAMDKNNEIEYNYINLKKEFDLNNRDWIIWKPLLATAKTISLELYEKIGKFAVITSNEAIEESIDEESWDYKLSKTLMDLSFDDEDSEKIISVVEIKSKMYSLFGENDKKPSSSWIGKHMNKIGFGKFRLRIGTGVSYKLNNKKIIFLLSSASKVPTLATLDTQVTLNNEEIEIKCDKKVIKTDLIPVIDESSLPIELQFLEDFNGFKKDELTDFEPILAISYLKSGKCKLIKGKCEKMAFLDIGKVLENGNGIDISRILEISNWNEEDLNKLMANGDIYEIRPGVIKFS